MTEILTQSIYIGMVVLVVLALIDFRGKGLLNLWQTTAQLQRASKLLKDESFADRLRTDILSDSADSSEELFTGKVMRRQMEQLREDVRKMGITEQAKCQCDIEDYFNEEFLDYQSNSAFLDHAASGLTALGILGTFFGMAAGLTGFDLSDSGAIISGISRLLLGMSTAFETSIAGIFLSLVLGTGARVLRGSADKALDTFVDRFHSNVLSDQHEAAANLMLERLENLETLFSADSDARQETMNTIAKEFVSRMGENLTDQVAQMRGVMEETTQQQKLYIASIQGLCAQVEDVGQKIAGVSGSFQPIVTQTQLLADQIVSANQSLQAELRTVSGIVAGDAAILSQQYDITGQMNRYASELEALSLRIAEQTSIATTAIANLSACASSAINDSQTALESQLRTMMLSASDFNEAMAEQSRSNMEMLHTHMEDAIRKMPRTTGGDSLLQELVEQNKTMIENQEKLLDALGRAGGLGRGRRKLMGLGRGGRA